MTHNLFLLLTLLTLTALYPAATSAQENRAAINLPMAAFADIPIQHEGRIKPLSRFAAIELENLSGGQTTIEPAIWLAGTLFDPQREISRPLILVDNEPLRLRLGLPAHDNDLYSLEDLAPHLAATQEQAFSMSTEPKEDLTAEQQALVTLHEKALTYRQLLQSMTAFLPLEINAPDSVGIAPETYGDRPTYFEIMKKAQDIDESVRTIIRKKGEDPERYTEQEKMIALLSLEYHTLRMTGTNNSLFRVLPPQWGESEEWLAPWALLNQGQGSPQSAGTLSFWQLMAKAYHDGDPALWEENTEKAYEASLKTYSDGGALQRRLKTEALYNALSPFKTGLFLYMLSLAAAVMTFARPAPLLGMASVITAGAGLAAHLSGIVMRIIILERAPVGSLYESLLFVSAIIVFTALIFHLRRADRRALISGTGAAALILFLSPVLAPAGDDLEMLVAVLNTNFWLATHVTCITAGYGVCILASVMAHFHMFSSGRTEKKKPDDLFKNIYLLSLIALLLTAVGTVLGGIWADQSWGRFWGWDPKENGALLIVLWLVWLLHGRMGGHLKTAGFTAGLAFLNVIVALSWFGVNLLSVGLHSYGFTTGLAWGLALFCSAEALLIGTLYYLIIKKEKVTA